MKNVRDIFNLQGRVAVVTGGAGHLGFYISEALAEAGAKVFIASPNLEKCKKAAQELYEKTGSFLYGTYIDIGSMRACFECLENIYDITGKIDILVNNACLSRGSSLNEMTEEDWIKGIDGSINGVFRVTKAVLKIMKRAGSGSIINIASMYGMVSPNPGIYGCSGYDNPANYGAGKAAIIQFTRYVACHLASQGIRVNSLSLGPFPSPEIQKNNEFISRLQEKVPLGRIGYPYEIKGSIIFLASEASSFITGANICVDGGWTAW